MTQKTLIIKNLSQPTRLDKVLRDSLPDIGRKAINELIQAKQVKINGKAVWLNSWKVNNCDTISVLHVPDALPQAPQQFDEEWIIADDGDVIALNKPVGLLSQGRKYGNQSNLLDLAIQRFGNVNLFHRLDRDTSGVILLTRGGAINRYLDDAFKAQTIRKQYVAIVHAPNELTEHDTISLNLDSHPKQKNRMVVVEKGGQAAITEYRTEPAQANRQRIYLEPKTGRTHQLRVHLAHHNAPILGDRLYSKTSADFDRLYLHAHQITLPTADNFRERIFTAPVPVAF